MGKLDVRIVGCRNLANTETFGVSDPYVTVSCEGKKYKTGTKKSTLCPEWNEKFSFMLADEHSARLELEVWDDNPMVDQPMGKYALALAGLVRGQVKDDWYILNNAKTGEIHVRVMSVDFGIIPCMAPSAPPQGQHPVAQYEGYPPQAAAYPPQTMLPPPCAPYYPPPMPPSGVYPGQVPPPGHPHPEPPPPGRTLYRNEDLVGQLVSGATLDTVDITGCTLWNCSIRKADFKGQNVLYNCSMAKVDMFGRCDVFGGSIKGCDFKGGGTFNIHDCSMMEVDVYGQLTLVRGQFTSGEVRPGGRIMNTPGPNMCQVSNVDNM